MIDDYSIDCTLISLCYIVWECFSFALGLFWPLTKDSILNFLSRVAQHREHCPFEKLRQDPCQTHESCVAHAVLQLRSVVRNVIKNWENSIVRPLEVAPPKGNLTTRKSSKRDNSFWTPAGIASLPEELSNTSMITSAQAQVEKSWLVLSKEYSSLRSAFGFLLVSYVSLEDLEGLVQMRLGSLQAQRHVCLTCVCTGCWACLFHVWHGHGRQLNRLQFPDGTGSFKCVCPRMLWDESFVGQTPAPYWARQPIQSAWWMPNYLFWQVIGTLAKGLAAVTSSSAPDVQKAPRYKHAAEPQALWSSYLPPTVPPLPVSFPRTCTTYRYLVFSVQSELFQ